MLFRSTESDRSVGAHQQYRSCHAGRRPARSGRTEHEPWVRFVDREDDKPKSQWKTNDDWAWFVGENREPIRLTTKPEPYTLQKALHWLQRQVAPTIKMIQALDKENHTTILKDMIEQAELKDKHKHLLQLEKSTIEERIDTAVPQENDGFF